LDDKMMNGCCELPGKAGRDSRWSGVTGVISVMKKILANRQNPVRVL
jgi:hypothetical protein